MPSDPLEEAVHEMLARLLAIGDDIEPGILLLSDDEERRIALRGRELIAVEPPGRPEPIGFGKPGRLR